MLHDLNNGYDADVLVVGAGPIGLVLAVLLRLMGVKVEIVDKSRAESRLSKGLTNNPAALEVFSQIPGFLKAFFQVGFPVRKVNVRNGNNLISMFSLDHIPSNDRLFNIVPQWRTEELLKNELQKNGVQVDCGHKLVNLSQDDASVTATIEVTSETGATKVRKRRYRYLAGCDGFHSTVRDLIGIKSPIEKMNMAFVMADAKIAWNRPLDRIHYCIGKYRFMVVVPLTDELCRIVIRHDTDADVSCWSENDYQRLVEEIGVRRFDIEKIDWKSSASIRTRIADDFVVGRICLAGDAAHAFSPVAGLGQNTGILDANHLSRTLAGLIGATAFCGTLHEYGITRKRIAQDIDQFTKSLTHAIANPHISSNGLSQYFFPSNRNNCFVTKELPWKMSGLPFRS